MHKKRKLRKTLEGRSGKVYAIVSPENLTVDRYLLFLDGEGVDTQHIIREIDELPEMTMKVAKGAAQLSELAKLVEGVKQSVQHQRKYPDILYTLTLFLSEPEEWTVANADKVITDLLDTKLSTVEDIVSHAATNLKARTESATLTSLKVKMGATLLKLV